MILPLLLQIASPLPAPPVLTQTPSPEALALGRRLAEHGTLATLLPMMVEKDLAELAVEKPLTAEQRARLLAIGWQVATRERERLMAAFGRGYAQRLSVADLRLLVAAAETPAAARKRAADLPVTAAAMQAAGGVDLKRETAARFCAETRLLCTR